MAAPFGLTPFGFNPMLQSDVVTDLQNALKVPFSNNINLADQSNFGQIVGIFSERFTLLWQLGQAVYSSEYPAGAEGTSVDNILAYNNLRRLKATPTRTALEPLTGSNGITLYPLVLFGTPGTTIPSGSIVQTSATPPIQFTIDDTVVISVSANAIQSLFFSNSPNVGSFSLSIVDPAGNTLTTASMAYSALSSQTLLNFSGLPAASTSFELAITMAGATLTTGAILTNSAYPTAAAIQSAITALSGYSGVTVSGGLGSYVITWGNIPNPTTLVTANTTTVTITPTDSVQSAVNNLFDSSASKYPYTDVQASTGTLEFEFTFGAGTPTAGQPSSASLAQAMFTVASNSLQMGSTVTNLMVTNTQQGQPAQINATATCTVDGPNFVAAGAINTIGSSISGWSGVINQLDCVTGTNVEDDTQALIRRQNDLNSQANGPLQAIVEKVSLVSGVTAAIGFENLNEAALQVITFGSIPVTGAYELNIAGTNTASIPYTAGASGVQSAIRAVPGFSLALVTGNQTSGFTVDFNGAMGGQPQPLILVEDNTTAVSITVAFGRPGKSFEIVVQGGSNADIAQAIYASKPAGIQSYGTTTVPVFDNFGNQYNISFSRPTEVPIYVVINLLTDMFNIPGNPGSGLNPNAKFSPGSIPQIQEDVVNDGNSVSIGGLIIGFGTNGLIGVFNSVPGIVSYTLFFGTTSSPSTNTNIQLLSEQVALFETFNVVISYT